eukprot:3015744-Pyramimonas_sp.AAC.1
MRFEQFTRNPFIFSSRLRPDVSSSDISSRLALENSSGLSPEIRDALTGDFRAGLPFVEPP